MKKFLSVSAFLTLSACTNHEHLLCTEEYRADIFGFQGTYQYSFYDPATFAFTSMDFSIEHKAMGHYLINGEDIYACSINGLKFLDMPAISASKAETGYSAWSIEAFVGGTGVRGFNISPLAASKVSLDSQKVPYEIAGAEDSRYLMIKNLGLASAPILFLHSPVSIKLSFLPSTNVANVKDRKKFKWSDLPGILEKFRSPM
jgi:hypothetical protein